MASRSADTTPLDAYTNWQFPWDIRSSAAGTRFGGTISSCAKNASDTQHDPRVQPPTDILFLNATARAAPVKTGSLGRLYLPLHCTFSFHIHEQAHHPGHIIVPETGIDTSEKNRTRRSDGWRGRRRYRIVSKSRSVPHVPSPERRAGRWSQTLQAHRHPKG